LSCRLGRQLNDEPGFFRAANGGTLFLDEVAELSLRAQAHLLRVLESHRVVPVGQTHESPADMAVVLATNRDLDEAIRERTLRPCAQQASRTFLQSSMSMMRAARRVQEPRVGRSFPE
jgi:transcriptional regulator with AAA-type ATPase domain